MKRKNAELDSLMDSKKLTDRPRECIVENADAEPKFTHRSRVS